MPTSVRLTGGMLQSFSVILMERIVNENNKRMDKAPFYDIEIDSKLLQDPLKTAKLLIFYFFKLDHRAICRDFW